MILFHVWYWVNNVLFYIVRHRIYMKVLTRLRFKGQCQRSNIKRLSLPAIGEAEKQHPSNDHVEDTGQIKINHPVIDNKRRPVRFNIQLSKSIWIRIISLTNHVHFGRVLVLLSIICTFTKPFTYFAGALFGVLVNRIRLYFLLLIYKRDFVKYTFILRLLKSGRKCLIR